MLRVTHLVKTYRGAPRPTLDGVSIAVEAGEVLWVSGASGAGKTTLLNVLGLLTGADSGRYQLAGVDMLSASPKTRCEARRDLVSTVFQRGNLFGHLSALDNVMLGLGNQDRSVAKDYLTRVGLEEKSTGLAGLLSGGEQTRVAFARAAARRTPLLLADEPLAGLDRRSASMVLQMLGNAADEGVSVVFVSHDDRAASIAHARLTLDAA